MLVTIGVIRSLLLITATLLVAVRVIGTLLLVAAATAVGWSLYQPERALWITVAVLVISCPCALSLATPAALATATGRLARLGLLVTRGHALETLARVNHVVFDKTGTLTRGRMRLIGSQYFSSTASHADAIARALEQHSSHPIAQALQQQLSAPPESIDEELEGPESRCSFPRRGYPAG